MLLDLKNIKKYFLIKKSVIKQNRQYVKAVDNISLTINEGENLGLVGESGSGKTTLGRVILKLYSPDEGTLILKGEDATRPTFKQLKKYRKSVQMVFQDPYSSLDPRYTVRSILKEADQMVKGAKGRDKRMEDILVAVGLNRECLGRFPHEFSGGERQRIAIARALMMSPKLLILDEAVSSLDVLIQEQILELLSQLQKQYKVTYLFISHNLRVVKKLCQRVAVMYKGKIVELGPADKIFHNPLHPYTQELLTAALEYRSRTQELKFDMSENSSLIDKGDGHFVLN